MSWPIDHVFEIFNSVVKFIESKTQIRTQMHMLAGETHIEPTIIVSFGGALGMQPEPSKLTMWQENDAATVDPTELPYLDGQFVEFPVEIVLHTRDTQGQVFVGRSMLASIAAATIFYKNAGHTIPIGSSSFTKTSVATGEPTLIEVAGFDGSLNITDGDTGISIKSTDETDGSIEFEFIQTWTGIFKIKVSSEIYQNMRLNDGS